LAYKLKGGASAAFFMRRLYRAEPPSFHLRAARSGSTLLAAQLALLVGYEQPYQLDYLDLFQERGAQHEKLHTTEFNCTILGAVNIVRVLFTGVVLNDAG
jgi:hypothetical protein